MDSERRSREHSRWRERERLQASANEVLESMVEGDIAVREIMWIMEEDNKGVVPDTKSEGMIRLYGENVKSLSIYDNQKKWKVKRLCNAIVQYQVDSALLIEGT